MTLYYHISLYCYSVIHSFTNAVTPLISLECIKFSKLSFLLFYPEICCLFLVLASSLLAVPVSLKSSPLFICSGHGILIIRRNYIFVASILHFICDKIFLHLPYRKIAYQFSTLFSIFLLIFGTVSRRHLPIFRFSMGFLRHIFVI